MKNVRKILAAVLAVVMVLAMMPAAFAADTTYTFDATKDLEAMAQGAKADGDTLKVNDYFTIFFSAKTKIDSSEKNFDDGYAATQRLNFGGKTNIAKGMNAVQFTTSGAASIKLYWACGGDGRQVAIYNEAGEVVSQSSVESVKNSPYISEFTVDAAGTYYAGNVGDQNYFFKIEVTEAAAAAADPAADSTLSIADAIALGASKEHNTYTEGKYYVTGVITEVYNTQYGNMYITDDAGNTLTVYGTYSADGATRYDKLETKPVAGDTVTVYGIIGQYKDTPQLKNGWITAHVPGAAPSDPGEVTVPATLAEQIAEANKLANNALLPYESTITGTITDEPQASSKTEGCYKFTVSDGTNSLLCYFVPVTGGTPKQGDTVTVTGKLTAYNGKAQFSEKNSTAALAAPAGDTYTVKAGDTLAKIALTHYGTVYAYKAIFEANSDILENPNLIRVGQVLTLPSEGKLVPAETETLYTVQPGDTLAKIALAHYGSASQYKVIFERNSAHLSNPNLIFVGQVLVLPAK